jgi:long-subunit fatty acid transport protein
MKTKQIHLAIICLTLLTAASARAQFVEDALRLAPAPEFMSPRAAAMGNAFTGLADDASALYWNPAGLGQLNKSDFSLGLTYLTSKDQSTFLSTDMDADKSTMHLNSLSFAVPFPVQRGSLVFAGGYQRLANFNNAMTVNTFNPFSSIQRSLYDTEAAWDLAWQLGLEDTSAITYQRDQGKGWMGIPVSKNVQQVVEATETGGLNQWSFGGSIEVAPKLLVGVAANILSGSYTYERTFTETDVTNAYSGSIYGVENRTYTDFQSATISDLLEQDLSGWNLKLGLLYNVKDKVRIGVSIQTPSLMTVEESYRRKGVAVYANVTEKWSLDALKSSYDINTPWVFSLGISGKPVPFVTLSADADFVDYTQLEFGVSWDSPLNDLNDNIRHNLRTTNNFRFGAEVNIPETDLFLRGGFGMAATPYKAFESNSDYNTTTFSGGLGYVIDEVFTINAAFVYSKYSTSRVLYSDPDLSVPESAFTASEKVANSRLLVGASYRF